MKSIWKVPLLPRPIQLIDLPRGADVLTVMVCDIEPYLFALGDLDQPNEQRMIYLISTGQEFDDTNMQYRGSFQGRTGKAVWHVFEGIRESAVKWNVSSDLLDSVDALERSLLRQQQGVTK